MTLWHRSKNGSYASQLCVLITARCDNDIDITITARSENDVDITITIRIDRYTNSWQLDIKMSSTVNTVNS